MTDTRPQEGAETQPRQIYDPIIDTPICYVREGEGDPPAA